jgi:hypothetical protein
LCYATRLGHFAEEVLALLSVGLYDIFDDSGVRSLLACRTQQRTVSKKQMLGMNTKRLLQSCMPKGAMAESNKVQCAVNDYDAGMAVT